MDRNDPGPKQRRRQAPAGDRPAGVIGLMGLRNWRLVAVGSLAIAIVFVVMEFAVERGSPPRSTHTRPSALEWRINRLLAGIPQRGDALGSPDAPIALQFYGDLECP